LFCADCGNKLYFVHGRTMEKKNFNFICSRNRKHLGEDVFSPHTIRECVLDEIVLYQIRRVTYEARKNTSEFVKLIQQKSTADNRKELKAKCKELDKSVKRNLN
ncbi:MAG: zinc ribbon domain-containing protein, partial [Eubacterium sp.]|nr:zinc ribbon domain-containing protein [Eubacterium sp.]